MALQNGRSGWQVGLAILQGLQYSLIRPANQQCEPGISQVELASLQGLQTDSCNFAGTLKANPLWLHSCKEFQSQFFQSFPIF
ncbi:hypothetical protein FNV43_RR17217 [Rhamnella rubrinervis]|uniref:Uncharacterized protein n=1 Tax=Rhamnella rubrinervis TaxID=2594499 RepID=A0A8K0GRP7_9ROSA|nr:hypothetical protein FNV43_RR17217 [Rhamnella rubrinervis]